MATTSQQPHNAPPISKPYMDRPVVDSRPGGPSPPEYHDWNPKVETAGRLGSSNAGSPTTHHFEPTAYERKTVRQIYTPRQPMYIPAALRPTDLSSARPTTIPTRPAPPDTPPASKGNSFDSASSASNTNMQSSSLLSNLASPPRNPNTLSSDPDFAHLNSRLNNYEPPDPTQTEVSGPPATSHWKPDLTSPGCVICNATFTWYFRRHHCRKCGFVVCGQHSLKKVPLDQNAHFHPNGYPSRACDVCHEQWRYIHGDSGESTPASQEEGEGEDTSVPSTPNLSVPSAGQGQGQAQGATLVPPVTGAEPRSLGVYGNWSTF